MSKYATYNFILKSEVVLAINLCDTEADFKELHDYLQDDLDVKHSLWYSRGKVETRRGNALKWAEDFFVEYENIPLNGDALIPVEVVEPFDFFDNDSPCLTGEQPVLTDEQEGPLEKSSPVIQYIATRPNGASLEFATKAELRTRFPHPHLDVIINSSLVTQGYRIKEVSNGVQLKV